jgi:hypothetical protein
VFKAQSKVSDMASNDAAIVVGAQQEIVALSSLPLSITLAQANSLANFFQSTAALRRLLASVKQTT